ncbi:uncharacterized protein HD556DRAFT_1476120 [Suillus plorans]|uniref:Peptidase M1 membrane alanine aminopeptidase domain-containing protein n=1 Tax=Suillus plorans TaxID=116603 RepID=A0A9P7AQ72_9AGAM|nr:uncharacterized protein HD556DRAFT_1476120 [Suillus plorans]KAG1794224.1 hypothetical protein HD556DRAFT_1476120 [Suillus plorans]
MARRNIVYFPFRPLCPGFSGELTGFMMGYYKSSFEQDGAKKYYTLTQFEMSTYLVAYANGRFARLESSYKGPLSGKTRPLRIYSFWVQADVIHQAQYALDIKAKVLPVYEEIFDIEYPLPKLDTLAARNFDAGAMENWIGKPMRSTLNITITPFTSVYPEWKVDSLFIFEHLNDAPDLDAKLSSHPIEVHRPAANQINQIFDSLSYAKAGPVLRMLSNFVGEERFLKGVSIYLKKHLYENTVTRDLRQGISESTGIGFPVIAVTEGENGIHARQDRFLESGSAEEKGNETIWNVPLALLTATNDKVNIDKPADLDTREKALPTDTSMPFKLNAGTYGVYRALYSDERFAAIARKAAKGDTAFSLNDRIGLLHNITTSASTWWEHEVIVNNHERRDNLPLGFLRLLPGVGAAFVGARGSTTSMLASCRAQLRRDGATQLIRWGWPGADDR